MKLPQTMRLATLVLLLTGTPLLLPAQPQPANHAPAPAWARQYDTFSRSEDGYIVSKGDKKGVVSLAGKPVTKLVYDTILPFRGGMAIVGTLQRSRFKTRGKYGFINQEGRLVVLMVHYFVNSFSEGLAFIQGDALHVMYINQQGDTAISMKGGFGEDFHGGMAAVGVGSELGGSIIPGNNPYQNRRNFIDRQGNLLIPARYDSIGEYVYYGIRTVKRHGKYGFLDTTGREVLPPAFDDMDYDSSYFWGNRRRVGRDGRFGFVDTYTGRLVVPLRYEGSLPSRDSTCWLKLNGKWGLVSRSGRTLVPFQYDQAGAFSEGLARVGKGGKAGHVNGRGEVVTPLQYDNVFPFREGRAMVIRGNACGFVDTRGREVIPAVYSGGQYYFKDGKVIVSRWGIVRTLDRTGRQVHYRLTGRLKTALAGALLLGVLAVSYRVYRRNHRLAAAAASPEGVAG